MHTYLAMHFINSFPAAIEKEGKLKFLDILQFQNLNLNDICIKYLYAKKQSKQTFLCVSELKIRFNVLMRE